MGGVWLQKNAEDTMTFCALCIDQLAALLDCMFIRVVNF